MRAALSLTLLLPLFLACSADWKGEGDDPNGRDGGGTDGGAADGGADGGTGDGGTGDGGTGDGGTDGGTGDGGDTGDGGTDGGSGDGGADVFCPVQVDLSAPSSGDGSAARPVQQVQAGIDVAYNIGCLQIEVHPGTYEEQIDFRGLDVDIVGLDGPEATVLDGQGYGPVVTINSGEGSGARLRGFTVTGGSAERGGGVYVSGADPVLDDLIVRDNSASGGTNLGGGLYLYDSEATLSNSIVQGNNAGLGGDDDGNDGGGLAILYGAPLIQGNRFLDNTAGDGGGIWVAQASPIILHNLLDGNRAQDSGRTDDLGFTLEGQGGGIVFQTNTGGALFTNNLVTNNEASTHGGGVAIIGFYADTDVANPTVQNNVLAWNRVDAGDYGDGIVVWGWSAPTVRNNAIVGHGGVGAYMQYSYASWTYNNLFDNGSAYGGDPGDLTGTGGNIAVAPGFQSVSDDGDGTNDDFALRSSSGMVDVGDPAVLDGDGTRSDVGAYGGSEGGW